MIHQHHYVLEFYLVKINKTKNRIIFLCIMDLGQIDLTIGLEETILLANHIFFLHNSEI